MENKFGILGLKLVFKPIIQVTGTVIDWVKKDRDWLSALTALGTDLFSARSVVDSLPQAWEELNDLNKDESFSLSEFFEVEFDIKDDELERVIELLVAQLPVLFSGYLTSKEFVNSVPVILKGDAFVEQKIGEIVDRLADLFSTTVVPIVGGIRLIIEDLSPEDKV